MSRLYLELAKTSAFAAVLLTPIAATGMIRADNSVPPSIRFLNIGNESTVFRGSEVHVELESSAAEAFRGTLEITLENTADPQWRAVNVTELSRTVVHLSLKRNETRRHEIIMPTVHFSLSRTDLSALVWRLYTPEGRLLITGREPTVIGTEISRASDIFRAVFVTRAPLETTHRIGVERAYSRSGRYAPFSHIVISIRDFADLTAAQKQAILDATGLGTILVLCDPADEGSDGKEPLDDYGQLIWRSGGGRALREIRRGLGMVRRVNLTANELAGTGNAIHELVFARSTLLTLITPFENPTLAWPFWGNELIPPRNNAGPGEVRARTVQLRQTVSWIVVLIFLLWASWRHHRLTANRSLPGSPARLGSCVSTIAVALLVQFALAFVAAGNIEQHTTVMYNSHEVNDTLVLTRKFTGGGGGQTDPWLELPQGRRSQFLSSAPRDFVTIVKTSYANGLPPRLEPNYARSSPSKALECEIRSVVDSRRCWRGQIEWRDGEGLSGRLEALDALQQVVILSNSRVARLGNVEAGDVVDLAEVSRALNRESAPSLTSSEYLMVRDTLGILARVASRHSAWTDDMAIIGLSKPTIGSNDGEGQHIVFQALRVALGDNAGSQLRRTAIPWSVADSTNFEFRIPDVLGAKLRNSKQVRLTSIGWGLEFYTDELGWPAPDERVDGFEKYTIPLDFDWTWERNRGLLFLVWDQAGEK